MLEGALGWPVVWMAHGTHPKRPDWSDVKTIQGQHDRLAPLLRHITDIGICGVGLQVHQLWEWRLQAAALAGGGQPAHSARQGLQCSSQILFWAKRDWGSFQQHANLATTRVGHPGALPTFIISMALCFWFSANAVSSWDDIHCPASTNVSWSKGVWYEIFRNWYPKVSRSFT